MQFDVAFVFGYYHMLCNNDRLFEKMIFPVKTI